MTRDCGCAESGVSGNTARLQGSFRKHTVGLGFLLLFVSLLISLRSSRVMYNWFKKKRNFLINFMATWTKPAIKVQELTTERKNVYKFAFRKTN